MIFKKPILFGILVGVLLLGLTQYLSYQRYLLNKESEQFEIVNELEATKERIQIALNRSLTTTKILAFLVEEYGEPKHFDSLAIRLLASNQFIDAIQLVKGGVITHVYPLQGNENVIDYNIFGDSARNKEATKAITEKRLFFSGPFELRQGGMGIVGRQPIFKENNFWGFAAVVIKLPTLLRAAKLDRTEESDFIHQLSKINPNTDKEEFFLPQQSELTNGVFIKVSVPDGEWNLYAQPKEPTVFFDLWLSILFGFIVSFTAGLLAWSFARVPKKLGKLIKEKTTELEDSIQRFKIFSSIGELRMDKFTAEEQATGFLIKVKEAFHVDACTIHLLDGDALKLLGSIGIENHELEDALPLAHPYLNRIIKEKSTLTIEDITKDTNFNPDAKFKYLSCASAPLIVTDHPIGVIKLYVRDVRRAFAPLELEHLYLVASQFAHIFQNTMLYEQNEKHKEVLVKQIVARKKIENAIKESEEKFRTLVESSPVGIFLFDSKGNVTYGNPADLRLTGLTWDETMGLNWINAIHPEDLPGVMQEWKEAVETGNSYQGTGRYLHKDGTIVHWHVITTPIIIDGKTTGFIGTVTDITERLSAEATIKESEKKYRSLIEQASDPILLYSFDGTIHEFNTSAWSISGYTKKEFASLKLDDILVGDVILNQDKYAAQLRSEVVTIERKLKRKDGSLLEMEINAKMTEDGKMLAFARDITERKKGEAAIRASEEVRRLVMDSALDAIVCIDLSGLITVWNPQAEKIFGWSETEIMGRTLVDTIVPQQYREKHKQGFNHYLSAGEGPILNKTIEVTAINREQKEFPIELSIIAVGEGEDEFFCAFIRDITERKKAEKELAASENYLRTILETEPECVKVLNPKGELISMNPAGLAMIEADNEQQVLKHRMVDLVDENYRVAFKKLTKNVFNGASGKLEFEVTGLKGTHRWLETHAVPMKDFEGNITSLLGVTRDITERKKSEEIIRQSEEKFKAAFYASPDSISITSIKTGKLIEINRGFTETFGFTRQEAIAKSAAELGINRNPPDRNKIEKYFEGGGIVNNAEGILYTKANEARSCLSSVVKLEWGNEPCLLSIIKDVTESKKAQQEIVSMNKQLRELSSHLQNIREEERANISREIHDELGQQLTGLRMDASWLNKKIKPKEKETEERIEGMIGLIDATIKTVRRISTELRPGILDDLGLLAALDWQSQEFEKRTGIKTTFSTTVKELELDKAIITGIFRVHQESLTNVARHSGAQKVESFLAYADNELVLSIRDDGKGMDEEDIAQRRTLGIVGMKERALMMGGEFQIMGIAGKGTTVTLRVPLVQGSVQ